MYLFTAIEHARVSKYFALLFSSLGIFFTTPVLYGIIWYERNNHHRTLINQNLASGMCFAMSWNFLVQIPTLFRYVFGPFNQPLCVLDMTIRNALLMQGLMYIDATMIIRYIFIFLMKNPTALQDDFWNIFINMWAFAWSLLSQFTLYFLPGKHPIHYCICVGQLPLEFDPLVKRNMPILVLGAASVIFYIFVCIRYHNHVTFKFNIKFWCILSQMLIFVLIYLDR